KSAPAVSSDTSCNVSKCIKGPIMDLSINVGSSLNTLPKVPTDIVHRLARRVLSSDNIYCFHVCLDNCSCWSSNGIYGISKNVSFQSLRGHKGGNSGCRNKDAGDVLIGFHFERKLDFGGWFRLLSQPLVFAANSLLIRKLRIFTPHLG
ncbi:MAG: hypothetical protein U1G07_25790, partial [Verrucomicrobiota bacterium]